MFEEVHNEKNTGLEDQLLQIGTEPIEFNDLLVQIVTHDYLAQRNDVLVSRGHQRLYLS